MNGVCGPIYGSQFYIDVILENILIKYLKSDINVYWGSANIYNLGLEMPCLWLQTLYWMNEGLYIWIVELKFF